MNLSINPPKKEEESHVPLWREAPSRVLSEFLLRLLLSRNRVGSLPLLLGHHLCPLLRIFGQRRVPSAALFFAGCARMRTKAGAA